MKNKSPNGHYPPGVPPGGKLLVLDGVKESIAKELIAKIQPHLNELNQENAAHQSAISLVFSAAIRLHGVEQVNGDLYGECIELADKLAKQNLRTTHEKAFELFVEQQVNPDHIPAHIIRAAGRQGVSMPKPVVFLPGDVVTDGEKRMTVDKQTGTNVECVWFDAAEALHRDTFDVADLKRADVGTLPPIGG